MQNTTTIKCKLAKLFKISPSHIEAQQINDLELLFTYKCLSKDSLSHTGKDSLEAEGKLLLDDLNNIQNVDWQITYGQYDIDDDNPTLGNEIIKTDNFDSEISNFLLAIDTYLSDEDETVFSMAIRLTLGQSDVLIIFDWSAFEHWWVNKSLYERIEHLHSYSSKGFKKISYSYQGNYHEYKLHYLADDIQSNIDSTTDLLQLNGFSKYKEYPLFFNWDFSEMSNDFEDSWNSCILFMELSRIFNFISFEEQNNAIVLKLDGYKSVKFNINLSDLEVINKLGALFPVYSQIFNWIYQGDGNAIDKLGIVRSVLSKELSTNNLNVDNHVMQSIQSNFKLYLKKNLEKYLEVKLMIENNIDDLVQVASRTRIEFESKITNAITLFSTFFVLTVVISVLDTNGDIKTLQFFSYEVCVLIELIIICGLFYISFVHKETTKEIDRIDSRIQGIKKRYVGLMHTDDIDHIIAKNEEFSEIRHTKNRCNRYLLLLLKIALFVTLLTLCLGGLNLL